MGEISVHFSVLELLNLVDQEVFKKMLQTRKRALDVLGLGRHSSWWRRETSFIALLMSALTGLTTDKIWFLLL